MLLSWGSLQDRYRIRWGMNRSSAEGWLGDGVGIEGDVIPHATELEALARTFTQENQGHVWMDLQWLKAVMFG